MGSAQSSSKDGYVPIVDRVSDFEPVVHRQSAQSKFSQKKPCQYTLIVTGVLVFVYIVVFLGNLGRNLTIVPTVQTPVSLLAFNTTRAMEHVRELSSVIGPRPTGSAALVRAASYVGSLVHSISQTASETGVIASVSVARGSGSFISDQNVALVYDNITNIQLTLTPAAVTVTTPLLLLSARLDSAFISPGAMSDAAAAAVLLETARALSQSSQFAVNGTMGVRFVWTGAGDGRGANLACSQFANSTAAIINVGAFGSGGVSAISAVRGQSLAAAYAAAAAFPHVPPVLRELQAVGLTLGSTSDYKRYTACMSDVPAIDLQWYSAGYLSQTDRDTTDNVQPGSLLHMGANLLSLTNHLAMGKQPLVPVSADAAAPVLFDFLGAGPLYIPRTGFIVLCALLSAAGVAVSFLYACAIDPPHRSKAALWTFAAAMFWLLSLAVSAVSVIFFGGLFSWAAPIAWYRSPYFAFFLYAPVSLLGLLVGQWLFHRIFTASHVNDEFVRDVAVRHSHAGLHFLLAVALPIIAPFSDTGAIALCFLWVTLIADFVFTIVGNACGNLLSYASHTGPGMYLFLVNPDTWFISAAVTVVLPALLTTDWLFVLLNTLLPAVGRFGPGLTNPELNPLGLRVFSLALRPDILLALLSVGFYIFAFVPVLPFLHRVGQTIAVVPPSPLTGKRFQYSAQFGRLLLAALALTLASFFLAAIPPYATVTPQRVHISHMAFYQTPQDTVPVSSRLVMSSLDERSCDAALQAALGVNYTLMWSCPSRAFCESVWPVTPPPLPAPSVTVLSDSVDPVSGHRLLHVSIDGKGRFFTAVAVSAPLAGWSLSPQLPLRVGGQYVINYVAGRPLLESAEPLSLSMTVLGARSVNILVRTHDFVPSPPLLALYELLPTWATLDPHGNYVAAQVNVTLPPPL